MTNFSVRTPYTITLIARNTPSLLLLVLFQGGCCQISHIWNNRILGDQFWKLSCWPLRKISIRNFSIGFEIPFYMSLFSTLLKSWNWLGRQLSTRAIFFPTLADFQISFIQSIYDCLGSFLSRKIQRQMIILGILFDISGFPQLWVNNVTVFTHSLLNKGTICNELLILHDTLFTNMKFLNKFRNFLIFMSCLEMEYRIRRIIKYVSYITEVLGIKSYVTIKALSIYQDLST